ncbi:MAG: M14 family metallopeptidase [Cyclobacteriaceae bacterium]|jgi:hypothetical protein|nr:M14 family metallopeptidase [Cyclobacteriaceae bacterium]
MKITVFLLLALTVAHLSVTAQKEYFYPSAQKFNPAIPTPEAFLGYPIGSHHTRYDKIVEYFKKVDELSDRVTLEEIGHSIEKRVQIVAKVTSPANHAQLEDIRQKHMAGANGNMRPDVPLVIQLGHNVHGNEPSGGESSLLTLYYLAANEDAETLQWLSDLVVLIDPVYNPDGRDRFSHWANMHKASPPVSDPADREHNEVWPGGRTNHYWFDLNRDWFLGIHPESRNRMQFFHRWRPLVMTDAHEMGTNSTFYFDPGKNSSNNPIVPAYLYNTVYPRFADYFSEAMNKIGSQYFTKEAFDKLYPGYGSSYSNFYGGAGFLFEQASSRGHVQETTTVPLTFGFTVRNQFVAALATVRASHAEKAMLINMRNGFYTSVAQQARANPVKGYVFGDGNDLTRTYALVNTLLMHQVEVYETTATTQLNGKTFEKGKSFVVPTEQPNYLMVRSAFEKAITYSDSLFYDASAWSLVHAFNLPHAEVRAPVAKGNRVTAERSKTPVIPARSDYAYLIDFTDYQAHRALYQLLHSGVIVKVAHKPFSARVAAGEKAFGYGTLIIPVQQQRLTREEVYAHLTRAVEQTTVDVHPVATGYNGKGIDLGSGEAVPVKKPEPLLVVGPGVSAYEAGEVWHLLDQRIGMPLTKAEATALSRIQLSDYNVIILVAGTYTLDKTTVDRLKAWVQAGGTLITQKTATEWAIKQGLAKEKLIVQDTTRKMKRAPYDEAENFEGAKQLGGAIFQVDVDRTHPIGFGITDRLMSFYRNGRTYLQPSKNPYNNVAQYTANPLIGGYVHRSQMPKVSQSAAIVVSGEGQGRVILFTDNMNFRGTWYGTNKLFLNALFFGPIIAHPVLDGE